MIKGNFLIKKETNILSRFLFKFIGLNDFGFQLRHFYAERVFKKYIRKGMLVINSASGNAAFDGYMRRKYKIKVFSFDKDKGALRRFPALKNKTAADALRLPVKPGLFDAAFSLDAAAHVNDPSAYLKNLHGALKEGGVLMLHTPVKNGKYFFKEFKDYNETRKDRVRPAFGEEEIKGLISQAGFKIIKTYPAFKFYFEGIIWEMNEKLKSRVFSFLSVLIIPLLAALSLKKHNGGILIEARK